MKYWKYLKFKNILVIFQMPAIITRSQMAWYLNCDYDRDYILMEYKYNKWSVWLPSWKGKKINENCISVFLRFSISMCEKSFYGNITLLNFT